MQVGVVEWRGVDFELSWIELRPANKPVPTQLHVTEMVRLVLLLQSDILMITTFIHRKLTSDMCR